jgi:hypothetical protein
MKTFIICILLTFALSAQIDLIDGQQLALQSSAINDLYLMANGQDCMSMDRDGRCGTIYGYHMPMAADMNINNLMNLNNGALFTLMKNDDYFCLRSVPFTKSFLYLDGNDCMNINTDKMCGRMHLYRLNNMVCSTRFGFRIRMLGKNYIMQSVQYPNVYIYFNGMGCMSLANSHDNRRCGSFTGHMIRNISNIPLNLNDTNMYRFMFFNLIKYTPMAGRITVGRH